MAANFKIAIRRRTDGVHLKLSGDFDGNSAFELIHTLKKLCKTASRLFIHTDSLKQIYPFGRNVFQTNLHLLARVPGALVISGAKAGQILMDQEGGNEGGKIALA